LAGLGLLGVLESRTGVRYSTRFDLIAASLTALAVVVIGSISGLLEALFPESRFVSRLSRFLDPLKEDEDEEGE
jgi:ABC-type dipeptide/oligopeptide/nickel transport system permease subunit